MPKEERIKDLGAWQFAWGVTWLVTILLCLKLVTLPDTSTPKNLKSLLAWVLGLLVVVICFLLRYMPTKRTK
jgi:hypothetical protein